MLKAIEVQLTKDLTVTMTEPKASDMAAYFRAIPVFYKIKNMNPGEGPIKGLPAIDITDEEMDKVLDLLNHVTAGLPEGQTVNDLSMVQVLRLFKSFEYIMPEEFEDFTEPAEAG